MSGPSKPMHKGDRMKRFNCIACILCVPLAFTTGASYAHADDTALVGACRALVTQKFAQWKFAPPPADVAEYAKNKHIDPDVTFGDFDSDGRRDVALLIQQGAHTDPDYPKRLETLHIAVCLNTKRGMRLHLIDHPYCGDGIDTAPRGHQYYNYGTGKEGVYQHDGVAAYCFEKAGATYEFDGKEFQEIVDSD